MNLFSGFVVYVVIWWLVFFLTLPWGAQSPHETGEPVEPGNAPSAPIKPRLALKAVVTTAVAAVLWGIAYLVISSDLISFHEA